MILQAHFINVKMPFIVSLVQNQAYLIWPADWLGISALLAFLICVVVLNWHWRDYQRRLEREHWVTLGLLLFAAPFAALSFGIRVPQWGALPLPNVSLEPMGGALMFLAAIPMVMGAWLLGPPCASVIGAVTGFSLAYWDTHSPFTILEFAFIGLLLSFFIRQRYRTFIFSVLRRPFLASLLLMLLYYLLFITDSFFWSPGTPAESLDYAISNARTAVAAMGGSLLIAGLIAEFALLAFPEADGVSPKLQPSPAESSLKIRFLNYLVWLGLVLIVMLMAVNWFVAGKSAEKMLKEQMAGIARTTTNEVPFFFNTGQSLIAQYTDDLAGYLDSPEKTDQVLKRSFRSIPFFSQLLVFDELGDQIASYPDREASDTILSPKIQQGITSAYSGVPIQVLVSPPASEGQSTIITFVGAIENEEGKAVAALVGQAHLSTNPFTQPIISDLSGVNNFNGVGYLLDEQGRVLYSSDPDQLGGTVMEYDSGLGDRFYESTKADGTRQLVYVKSAVGRPWVVMLTVPAVRAQQMALDLAAPLSGMVLLIALFATGTMYVGLSSVADSLHVLTEEADRISKGDLDHALEVDQRVDEVGRMREAFEEMRKGLKARMQELGRLLSVSRGVASSLEITEAVKTILKSALDTGASSARIVLDPSIMPEEVRDQTEFTNIGIGPETEKYKFLDPQILEIARERSPQKLSNPTRMPLLEFGKNDYIPGAVLAVALRHEQKYYGSLWLAFEEPHTFPDSEVRFVVTLAGQAALAASNSQLFMKAEIGRQRLAAILASTPDPILVTDHRDRLLLANPAAKGIIVVDEGGGVGEPIEDITDKDPLINLLRSSPEEKSSKEIELEDGRIFLATASPVVAEERQIGRVCVLRDITQLKEVDELKSDFVSTVSHDLRSPLTLMRGYATMLEMVGELNEEQQNYVNKIIRGVESMSHLVQNLLDLGRIEAEVGLKLDMISASDIIAEVTENLELQAKQKNIEVHVSAGDQNLPFISADKALLQQALRNLLDNAIKFTSQGGEIWVRYKAEGDHILFEIEDTGIGISPVDQQHLFEKFYKVESREKEEDRGTGLGLAIVKSIAERHGGRVWVESELGKGSTFYLSLPIQHEKAREEGRTADTV